MSGHVDPVVENDHFDRLAEALASSQILFWMHGGLSTAEFFSFVNRLLLVVINAAGSADDTHHVSSLTVEVSGDPNHADDFGVQGRDKVVIGERLLERLNRSITAYTGYLVYNFRLQTAPAIGPEPKYYEVLEPAGFADRAVQMYSRAYLPRTATDDGFVRSDYENLLTTLLASFYPDTSENQREQAQLSFSLPKTSADIRVFHSQDFDEEEAIGAYAGEEERHRKLLHARLLCGALMFAIAHEVAHVKLGHTEQHARSPAASRRDEFLADELAYSILEKISGFNLTVLPVLFSFIQTYDNISEDASHPLSAARLRTLYDQLLKKNGSPAARGEVSAALSLLTTNVDPIRYRVELGNDRIENLRIACCYYQDPSFVVRLYLYLQRKPILDGFEGINETRTILNTPAVRVNMTITNGDDPGNVIGKAISFCHRETASTNAADCYTRTGDVIVRRDLEIFIPPELWLATPNIQVRVDSVDIAAVAPIVAGCSFRFDRPIDNLMFEVAAIEDARLLLAARWYYDNGAAERALTLYEHVRARSPFKMEYADLIALSTIYADKNRFADLEVLARACLAKPEIRPGFYYFLGLAREGQGDDSDALECAFQEMFGMGEHSAFYEKAGSLFANILRLPRGNWIDYVRGYYAWTMAADRLPRWLRWLRLQYHVQAYQQIRLAEAAQQMPYLCVREIRYEAELMICQMARMPLASAKAGFESIIEQQPKFVPAYIQLAGIENLDGNKDAAKQWWRRAKEILPSHQFVLDYRGAVLARASGGLTATRFTGPVRKWLGRQVLLGTRVRFPAVACLQFISLLEGVRAYLRYRFARTLRCSDNRKIDE